MNIFGGLNRIVSLSFLVLLLSVTTASFAGNAPGKSPYHKDHNPLSFYYFGYNTIKPGFAIGTHVNLSWTKMEKAGCKGSKISDRQFAMIPTVGMFQNEANTLSAFGALEFNYNVTFSKGFTLQFFGAPGYAQMLSGEESISGTDNSNNRMLSTDAHSGFMPMAGAGIGYDFQKLNGKDCPLKISLRGMATSTEIAEMSIFPSFQSGITYSF
jgi:hypothetical protein